MDFHTDKLEYPPDDPVLEIVDAEGPVSMLKITISSDAKSSASGIELIQTENETQEDTDFLERIEAFRLEFWNICSPSLVITKEDNSVLEAECTPERFALSISCIDHISSIFLKLSGLLPSSTYVLKCKAFNAVAYSEEVTFKFTTLPSTSGFLYAWGNNESGYLGFEPLEISLTPILHERFERDMKFVDVCTFSGSTLALTDRGSIIRWGLFGNEEENVSFPFQIQSPIIFRKICVGDTQMGAICIHGNIYSWGKAERGCLGHHGLDYIENPTLITQFDDNRLEKRVFTDISSGSLGYLACTDRGELYEWGVCANPLLGNFVVIDRPHRKVDSGISSFHVLQVTCGKTHFGFVTAEKYAYTWGDNTFGQLGNGNKSSTSILQKVMVEGVIELKCGSSHSGCICEDGRVWMWGRGKLGALGDPKFPTLVHTPQVVEGLIGKSISLNSQVTLVVADSDQLYSFGEGKNGCLGIGVPGKVGKPCKVKIPRVFKACVGEFTSYALSFE